MSKALRKYIMVQLDDNWDEETPSKLVFPNASDEYVLELDDKTAMLYQHTLHDYYGPYRDAGIVMLEVVEQTTATRDEFIRNVVAYQDREIARKQKEADKRQREADAAAKKKADREAAKLLKEATSREALYQQLKAEFEDKA